MALNKGIWDPKLRGTNIKGTNLKSLTLELPGTKIAVSTNTASPETLPIYHVAKVGISKMVL